MNLLLLTDSYKITHWKQYPPGTENVYSYFESRGGKFPHTLFFGLQYFLKKYLAGPVVTKEKIEEAAFFLAKHFNDEHLFNKAGWTYILEKYGGCLPVVIKAVPEGTVVPVLNVLMTIENTDPKCYWLTNYLETLLVQVWYPTTVATLSMAFKRMILNYLEKTGDPHLIDFKVHDFGFRGVSSVESAGLGGMAHLVNFKGTDTLAAITCAKKYYGEAMAGFSIPAAEHSTIVAWGKENEEKAFANMLEQFKDQPLVACVSDSYDIYKACRDLWGHSLKEKVSRFKGTLVIRPDSGYQPEVAVKVLNILGGKFGTQKNKKGFKVLPNIRIIEAGGLNYEITDAILKAMQQAGWSADNIAFGVGGGLLQKIHRDTQQFAFKCSSVTIRGKERAVFKDPITDKEKISKPGKLKLILTEEKNWKTVIAKDSSQKDQLVDVFKNGKLLQDFSFTDIRKRAAQ